MGIPVSDLEEELFSYWLYGIDEPEDNIRAAENILDFFDSPPSGSLSGLPSIDDILAPDNKSTSVYYGIEGLRNAVLRFLSTAVKERSENMYLYSDMDQSWMTQDRTFLLKWAALMLACVKNETHINIIHNLDRSLEEMSDAIRIHDFHIPCFLFPVLPA